MGERIAELIERMERASGPDRELDCAIIKLLYGVNPYPISSTLGGDWKWYSDDRPIQAVPVYTSSIDAALSLVPEGYMVAFAGPWVYAEHHKKAGQKIFEACIGEEIGDFSIENLNEVDWNGRGPNFAIALCIAALRSRSHSVGE